MVCSASAVEEGQALLPGKAGQRSPPRASLPATPVKAGVVTVPSPSSPGVRRPCMEKGLLLTMRTGRCRLSPRRCMPLQTAAWAALPLSASSLHPRTLNNLQYRRLTLPLQFRARSSWCAQPVPGT